LHQRDTIASTVTRAHSPEAREAGSSLAGCEVRPDRRVRRLKP
jgi:hypothetical protein